MRRGSSVKRALKTALKRRNPARKIGALRRGPIDRPQTETARPLSRPGRPGIRVEQSRSAAGAVVRVRADQRTETATNGSTTEDEAKIGAIASRGRRRRRRRWGRRRRGRRRRRRRRGWRRRGRRRRGCRRRRRRRHGRRLRHILCRTLPLVLALASKALLLEGLLMLCRCTCIGVNHHRCGNQRCGGKCAHRPGYKASGGVSHLSTPHKSGASQAAKVNCDFFIGPRSTYGPSGKVTIIGNLRSQRAIASSARICSKYLIYKIKIHSIWRKICFIAVTMRFCLIDMRMQVAHARYPVIRNKMAILQ